MGFLQNSSFLQRSKQPRDCSVYSISSISAGISASPPVGAGPAAPPDLATSAWLGSWTSFIFAWSSSVVLSGFSSNQLRTSSQYVLTEGTFSPIWLIVWYSTLSNWFLAST